MIKGEKKLDLEKEIKQKLTEYDIYRMFCPVKFTVGKKFNSPIPGRKDDSPSFLVGCKNGSYYHIDFGESKFRGDSIEFVKQMLSTDFKGALEAIGTRFGLSSGKWKTIVKEYQQPVVVDNQREVHIASTTKLFTPAAHKYWNAYHLSEEHLKKKLVFQLKDLWIGRKKFPLDPEEIVFGYYTPEGYQKIYRPTVPRKVPKDKQYLQWRFKGNLPFTYMFGRKNIKNCDKTGILKSYKDELVTELVFPCCCSLQGESIACLNKENVDYINGNSKQVFLMFGSDTQGVEESQLITSTFRWSYFNTPKKYLPHNDNAEIAKSYGLETLEKLLKQKGIL